MRSLQTPSTAWFQDFQSLSESFMPRIEFEPQFTVFDQERQSAFNRSPYFDSKRPLTIDSADFYVNWLASIPVTSLESRYAWAKGHFFPEKIAKLNQDLKNTYVFKYFQLVFDGLPASIPIHESIQYLIGLRLADFLFDCSWQEPVSDLKVHLSCLCDQLLRGSLPSKVFLLETMLSVRTLNGYERFPHFKTNSSLHVGVRQVAERVIRIAQADSFFIRHWKDRLHAGVEIAIKLHHGLSPHENANHHSNLQLLDKLHTCFLIKNSDPSQCLQIAATICTIKSLSSPRQATKPADVPTPALSKEVVPHDAKSVGPMLTVCLGRFAEANDKDDDQMLKSCDVLKGPLPLAAMPTIKRLEIVRKRLAEEFPWLQSTVATIFDPLIAKAVLGCNALHLEPTLFVGHPGSGKTRFMRRLTELLELVRVDLPMGGTSDSKVISGTSRGWGSGRPSDVIMAMVEYQVATVSVNMDELEKVSSSNHNGNVHQFLLALLEPETSKYFRDSFLKTRCDLSGVIWLATANGMQTMPSALVSRFRVLHLEQPKKEDHRVIAEGSLNDLATLWRVPLWSLPTVVDLDVPWERLSSAREVRRAVEMGVTKHVLAQRHAPHSVN